MIYRAILRFIIFFVLTLLTQIGGLIYLLVLLFARIFGWKDRAAIYVVFIIFYAGASFASTYIAPVFGRVAIPCTFTKLDSLKTAHPIFCALNRNYVTKDLAALLKKASQVVNDKYPGTITLMLDGSFPFVTGFPLLPHLSHHDGRKVDLAFYYQDGKGGYLPGYMKSPIGYWGYTQPREGESSPCEDYNKLSLRWDFNSLQKKWRDYKLEPLRNAFLLNWLTNEGRQYGLEKILLEPHIKSRLNLKSDLIRFQGCRAARHDDHIHLQVGG
jgi:hypothetical protein